MIRVLHVLEATLGGTRRYLEDLFRATDRNVAECGLVFATGRADTAFFGLLEELRAAGWQTFEIDFRRKIDLMHDARCSLALRRVVRRFRPHIVHAHSSKAGALARIATRGLRARPKVIYAPNAIAAHLGVRYLVAEKVLSPFTDLYTPVSKSEQAELQRLRLAPPDRFSVVAPTVRSAYFVPQDRGASRALLGLSEAPVVIGIGRLSVQKDPCGFVQVMALARRELPALRGIWVGDGELRGAVEDEITATGQTGFVEIAGWQEDVRPYLGACDLFLSTSVYESFGYVTAEALAMDRPAVASAITGTIDIIVDDTEETLYRQGDYAAAAAALVALLRDPERAADIAARGRARVLETFSADATQASLLGAYDKVLSR